MFTKVQQWILKEQTTSIGVAALIVAFFGIASRFLGLVRDRMLAANFGAGDELDVYYAAFRLPDFFFELLIVGSLAAAFVPTFSKLILGDDKKRAWRCANDLLVVLMGALFIFCIIGFVFAPFFMHLIAPGFTEEKLMMSVNFSRIMFLSPLFLTMSALFGSILVSRKLFFLYASAPLLYNIGIISGILFLTPALGPIGLAWGVALGAVMHFLVHLYAVQFTGFQFMWPRSAPYKNKDVRQILRMMVPRIFGSASNQIALIITTVFASILAAGSLTVFTFAYNIQSVVLGLVGVSFALAAFPTLSTAYAEGHNDYFAEVFERTLRRILYYAIPLAVFFWVLRAQIVRIIYGAGHFDNYATFLTVEVLSILLISLFVQSIIPLLARTFYAMHDTRTPLYAALFSQVINIIMIVVLIEEYRIFALAAAFSIATILNASILLVALKGRVEHFNLFSTFRAIGIISVAAIVAASVVQMAKWFIGFQFGELIYVWQYLVQLIVPFSLGILMYLGMSAVFGLKEYDTIRKKIFVRMFGRPVVAAEEQHQGTGSQ